MAGRLASHVAVQEPGPEPTSVPGAAVPPALEGLFKPGTSCHRGPLSVAFSTAPKPHKDLFVITQPDQIPRAPHAGSRRR
jgi:hypothetical protein